MKALYVLALLCLTVTTTLAASAATTTTDVNYIDLTKTSIGKKMIAVQQNPESHKKALTYLNPNVKERNNAISHITNYHHKKMSNSTETTLLKIDKWFWYFTLAEIGWTLPGDILLILAGCFVFVPDLAVVWIFFALLDALVILTQLLLFPLDFFWIFLWFLQFWTGPYEAVMLFFLITNYGPYSLVQKKSTTVCKSDHEKSKVESLWAKKDYAGIGKQLCTIRKLPKEIAKKTGQDQPEKREQGKRHQATINNLCGGIVKATHESTDDLVKGLDLHGFDSKSTFCENKLVSSYSF